jgi:CRISPR/Cas system CSM-associated protein Csm2 small subunit
MIIMDDDLPETVEKCLKILEENMDILSNIEIDLNDEKEDEIVPDMQLHQLFDMTEDVSESSKIKRAELNLARRNVDYSL